MWINQEVKSRLDLLPIKKLDVIMLFTSNLDFLQSAEGAKKLYNRRI